MSVALLCALALKMEPRFRFVSTNQDCDVLLRRSLRACKRGGRVRCAIRVSLSAPAFRGSPARWSS
jgi:hypothetical protein